MSRKGQYFGISVFTFGVILFVSLPFTSDVQRSSLIESPEKHARHDVTKITTTSSDSFLTSSPQVPPDKVKTFEEIRINRGALIANSLKNRSQSHSENQYIAGTENIFTTDYNVVLELNNSSHNTKNLTLSNRFREGEDDVLKEKRHIAFLKVHKAASTTLQTMFFRFGFERNLSFVLPVKGNYFSHSTTVHEDIVPPLHGDHYDIICNHGFFSYEIYSNLMPKDTVYLAVVRNPLDQFISAVNYYTQVYKFRYLVDVPGDRIENLIEHPEKYDAPLSYTMNSMARDYGFKPNHFFSKSNQEAKDYLEKLSNIIDFVLIAEQLDESLILMKRLLNWSLKDILYISKNVRGSEERINERLMKKFRVRNKLDYMVYEFFYNKFKTKLKESEDSVNAETAYFKRVLITVQNWCLDTLSGELTIEASEWNKEFVINTRDCQLMTKHELNFIKLLKNEL